MRTTRGVVNISGSLLPFLGLEGTACQGMVSLVAPYFIIRRRTADVAEEFLLPLGFVPLDIDRTIVIINLEDSPP